MSQQQLKSVLTLCFIVDIIFTFHGSTLPYKNVNISYMEVI
jgi:hypothetical protein